jgi:hypothetical protein
VVVSDKATVAALNEWAHAPRIPDNHTGSLTVIRVTPSAVEQHVLKLEGNTPDFFTPVGEAIYANCQGNLCKWEGDHFENATQDGIERYSVFS